MNVWENAKANAKHDCEMCQGTGTYMYDHNHGTICKSCCKHDMGWWELSECHGAENAGKMCCSAGCGHTISQEEYNLIKGK